MMPVHFTEGEFEAWHSKMKFLLFLLDQYLNMVGYPFPQFFLCINFEFVVPEAYIHLYYIIQERRSSITLAMHIKKVLPIALGAYASAQSMSLTQILAENNGTLSTLSSAYLS